MNTQVQTSGSPDLAQRKRSAGVFHGRRHLLFILVFDAQNLRLLDANENASRQYGFVRDEFLQMTLKDLVPHARYSKLLRFVRNMPEQLMSAIVCEHLKKDGSTMPVEMQCYKFLFQGQPAVVALTREITAPVQLDRIRAHAPRSHAAGEAGTLDIISRVDRRLMFLELRREIDRLAGQSADAIRESGAGSGDPDRAADLPLVDAMVSTAGSGWFSGWGARFGRRHAAQPQPVRHGGSGSA